MEVVSQSGPKGGDGHSRARFASRRDTRIIKVVAGASRCWRADRKQV